MRIILFAKAFAVFTVLAMIGVFASPYIFGGYQMADISFRFLQFEALALALAIATAIIIPPIFGVLKNEDLLIISRDPVRNRTSFRLTKALERGKIGAKIRIKSGGGEEVAIVESYSGIVTPARVSVRVEENIQVI